jgi:hypothetical protein
MALVAETIPFMLTVQVRDGVGRTGTLRYKLQEGTLIATALTDALAIIAALADVTGLAIDGYSVSHQFYENSQASPTADVKLNEKAQLTMQLSTDDKLASIYIPAPVIGIFQGATGDPARRVALDDADLLTYVGLFAAASEAFISDGEVATGIVKGVRVSSKVLASAT